MSRLQVSDSEIIIGWAIDNNQHPKFWVANNHNPGVHTIEDLVSIPASEIIGHTAIIV
jgi:hypothetical protein